MPVEIVSESSEQGVVEQRFDLRVNDEVVPGLRWSPEGASTPRPTVLIGHGGTQHKRAPNVLSLGRRFVRHLGYNAVALDAPGHGDRITDPAAFERRRQALQDRIASGPGTGELTFGQDEAAEWVRRTQRGVAEWKALLDELDGEQRSTSYGYWGVSMGTAIGLPFVASEPRITAAVLGLAGLGNRPGGDDFRRAAEGLRIPVLLVLQWNDELVSKEAGIALFEAIGSGEKTAHINPGGHVQIPMFERDEYDAFFRRHLGPAA